MKPPNRNLNSASFGKVLLAWCVHSYTALGLVLAGLIGVCVVHGTQTEFAWAFVLMWIATIIDSTDGFFARAVGVKQVLPQFDGRRLDDLTDFLNYTFLPLLLIWRAELVPPGAAGVLLFCVVASAYGFCQADAKTDDGYFLGFPSYWNLVAFYLYLLGFDKGGAAVLLGLFAILTFVPIRYLYPSQPGFLNRITSLAGIIWALYLLWLLHLLFDAGSLVTASITHMARMSLVFPAYYFLASLVITFRVWSRKNAQGFVSSTIGQ